MPPEILSVVHTAHRYLLALCGHEAEAEELLQRVFIRLFEKREHLDPSRNLHAYACKIAHREFFQERRDQQRRAPGAGDALLLVPAEGAAPDNPAQQEETAAKIQVALFELPVAQREVVQLRLWEDLSWEEIVEITGEPRTTLATRFQKALDVLQGKLNHLQ